MENRHQFARPNILLVTIPCPIKSSMCHYTECWQCWLKCLFNEELFYVTESSVRKGGNHLYLRLTTEIKYSWAHFKIILLNEENLTIFFLPLSLFGLDLAQGSSMFETDLKSPSIIKECSFSWNRNKVSTYNDLSRPFWKRKKSFKQVFCLQ